jgi:hypothetical protein
LFNNFFQKSRLKNKSPGVSISGFTVFLRPNFLLQQTRALTSHNLDQLTHISWSWKIPQTLGNQLIPNMLYPAVINKKKINRFVVPITSTCFAGLLNGGFLSLDVVSDSSIIISASSGARETSSVDLANSIDEEWRNEP